MSTMSAVTACLAPRCNVSSRSSASTGARSGQRSTGPLPTRYTVPYSVLPNRSTFVRRRVGAVVFVVALVLSVGSVAQRGLADRGGVPASGSAVGRTTTGGTGYAPAYVVHQGDTLWAIAERLYPGRNVAQIVDALVSLNGGASIQVGQTLNLP